MNSPELPTEKDLDGLLEDARHFDPQALAALHDQLYPHVYRYVCYRVEDSQVCEDISAEVFLRFLVVLKKKGQKVQSARGWLLGTANHLVMDFYRKKYRRRDENLDHHTNLPDNHNPEQEAETSFTLEEVREAMHNLTSDQQHVITLRFSQEFSLEETARMMGKSINAVKVLQYRALAALRRQLDGR